MEDIIKFFAPHTFQYYVLLVVGGFIVYKAVKFLLRRVFKFIGKRFDHRALYWRFLESTIYTVLLLAVLFTVLSELPVLDNLSTSLMAGSTVLIAAIGFAAQEPMANIISGMFLSFFKPFGAGDRIKLHSIGIVGWIEDLGLRHTVIRTVENNRLLVPNSIISRDIVENSNFSDEKILNFLDVKITYESDFDRAMEIMREEVTRHPGFLDTRSEEQKAANESLANVMVRDIANNCAELRVGVWTANVDMSFQVCSDLRAQVLRRFKEEGIQLYRVSLSSDRIEPTALLKESETR